MRRISAKVQGYEGLRTPSGAGTEALPFLALLLAFCHQRLVPFCHRLAHLPCGTEALPFLELLLAFCRQRLVPFLAVQHCISLRFCWHSLWDRSAAFP